MKQVKKIIILLLFCVICIPNYSLSENKIKIGVSAIDITPKESIWLNGYGGRTKPSDGVTQPIYAKAIAFEDESGTKAVLVTTDLIGFHKKLSEEIADRVNNELGIPRSNLLFSSSHTHAGPILYGTNLTMFDLSEQEWKTIKDYTDFLKDAIVKIIKNSITDLSPCSLTFGKGKAYVAMNRRVFSKDRVRIGVNPDGPTDTELPVLCAFDSKRNKKAVLYGYACHGTTLGGQYQICGDYMGYANEYLDIVQPGVTNMFVAGCGADANPEPRGTLADARINGIRVAGAVAEVIAQKMKPVNGPIRCEFKLIDLAFAKIPTADEFKERLNSKIPHIQRHARYFLNIIQKGESIPTTYQYPVQVWRLGDDLTIVTLGGEVVVDYALRLKRELSSENIWTIAYANDVCGYIGSARILYEGGYEADDATLYYSLPNRWDYDVEDRIISAVYELIQKTKN